MSANLFALLACAGSGSRLGFVCPKQYVVMHQQNAEKKHDMLSYSLSAFHRCEEFLAVLLVIAPNDTYFKFEHYNEFDFAVSCCGGKTRRDSVLAGLRALNQYGARAHDWVLVHDVARPGITSGLIRRLIHAVLGSASSEKCVGGILALPVSDTLKSAVETSNEVMIGHTLARNSLWQAQTPQMFRIGLLQYALEEAAQKKLSVTDEANAVEALGYHPLLVLGSPRNFKITYPEDFIMAKALL